MKLIFLTSRFPYPLEKGDKLRSYNIIKELSKNNEIILISLNDIHLKDEYIEHMKKYVKEVHVFNIKKLSCYFNTFLAFFKNIPLQVGYFYNPLVKRKIQKIINNSKPDHIFCQLVRTTEYVKDLDIKKTLDYQDVFSHGVKRRIKKVNFAFSYILKLEYKKLLAYEKKIFDYFDHKVIISEPDRDLIPHKNKNEIHVIANGVDSEYFNPELFKNKSLKYDLLFTGNMSYPPNIDCSIFIVKRLLPLIRKTHPEITFCIAGANPHKSILKLKSDKVFVTGWVDDIRLYYSSSKIFLAPMQIGTGLQNKLLEAMAMGLPCVTSSLANSALHAKDGKEILVADWAEDFSKHIIKLIEQPSYASEIAVNGQQFLLNNYSWRVKTDMIQKIINT